MERSDSIKELVTALAKAQGEIGKAIKDVKNEFFKSKYADLASVTDAIKEPLSKHGLSYTQVMHDAEHAVCVETMVFHNSGEWLSTGKLTVPVSKLDAQGFGSALTYTRRYSLSAAFGVAPEEDDGNAAAAAKPSVAKSVALSDFDKLAQDRKKVVADYSVVIIDAYRTQSADAAYVLYEQAKLSLPAIEEQTALWGQFASDIRAGIKQVGIRNKAKPTAEELLSTP